MKWNRWLGIVLVVLSATCLVISIWPVTEHSDQVTISSSGGIAGTLRISQPDKIKVGNSSEVRLEILLDLNQNEIKPLTFLSKLELDNITVSPQGEGKVSVDPTKPVKLNWQITPYKSGIYSGTLWLFVENDDGERTLVLARPIELSAITLFGLSFPIMRMISIAILIFGSFLFVPLFRKNNIYMYKT